jgi:hypothetical protein
LTYQGWTYRGLQFGPERALLKLPAACGKHTLERILVAAFGITTSFS